MATSGLGFTFGNGYVNRMLRAVTFSDPTTLFLALFTVAPTDSGGGTEVAGGSYARLSIACNTSNWGAPSSGAISNTPAQTFATASASWGTVTDFALFDAATVGNIGPWADLTASKTIGSGDVGSFAAGQLTISIV